MTDNSGPAFPKTGNYSDSQSGQYDSEDQNGMTLRQYAAIKLRVPDSGLDWLDEMITKANRDELAKAAMTGLCANQESEVLRASSGKLSCMAYEMADAMLQERGR